MEGEVERYLKEQKEGGRLIRIYCMKKNSIFSKRKIIKFRVNKAPEWFRNARPRKW